MVPIRRFAADDPRGRCAQLRRSAVEDPRVPRPFVLACVVPGLVACAPALAPTVTLGTALVLPDAAPARVHAGTWLVWRTAAKRLDREPVGHAEATATPSLGSTPACRLALACAWEREAVSAMLGNDSTIEARR